MLQYYNLYIYSNILIIKSIKVSQIYLFKLNVLVISPQRIQIFECCFLKLLYITNYFKFNHLVTAKYTYLTNY